MLTVAIATPISGKLADIYGRKKIYLVGMVLFLLGAGLCGVAQNMPQLIAFRILQGIGGGVIYPVILCIIGDMYDEADKAKMMGLINVVWFMASLAGPWLGGLIVDAASWHWVFFMNIPIGIIPMFLIYRFLKEEFSPREHSIDYKGAVGFILGSALILYAILTIGKGEWSWWPLFYAGAGIIFIAYFIRSEVRSPEPIIPMGMLKLPNIFYTNMGSFIFSLAMIGFFIFLPLWIQDGLGYNAMGSGFALTPIAGAWSLAGIACGRLYKIYGERNTALAGGVFILVGCLALAFFIGNVSSIWFLAVAMLIVGTGYGLVMTTFFIVSQEAVEWEDRGSASGLYIFLQSLGQTLGSSFLGMLFAISSHGAAGGEISPEMLGLGLRNVFLFIVVLSAAGMVPLWKLPRRLVSETRELAKD